MHPIYPESATFAPKDWEILARHWHPVALVEEITEAKPFGAVLLDVPIVLYRIGEVLTVALDRCPHRGTRLSLGHVRGGRLICPYHGLEFDSAGQCVGVPAHGATTGPARYLELRTMLVAERFGLVWVCLIPEPAAPLPDWSVIEQPGNQRAVLNDFWNASAGRHVENFCDLGHFAFIHAGTFGSADHVEVETYDVEHTNSGFRYIVDIPMLDGSVFDESRIAPIRSEYHVSLPFSTRLTMHYSKGIEHICDVASPVSAERCRIFILKSRDHDQDQPVEEWSRFQHAVNEEDRVMVESQTPRGIPMAAGVERHLSSDRFSVLFRRHWAEQGLGGSL
jgi:phenylpropionate dioxygenase-like ring-hydroxylating dioxygenase large terminal subunit